MANPPERFIPHPGPVTTNVLRQTGRAAPRQQRICTVRVHWRLVRKLRRDLDHRLVDEHGDGVQVTGECFEAKPLGFERNGAATGERVVEPRHLLRVEKLLRLRVVLVQFACLSPRLADLVAGRLQDGFLGGVLPSHEVFDDREESGAGLRPVPLHLRARLLTWVLTPPEVFRVVNELREDDRASRRQGPSGPPEMQGGGVAVTDRLLACGGGVDRIQRQSHFDQLLRGNDGMAHGHWISARWRSSLSLKLIDATPQAGSRSNGRRM